MPKNKKQNIPYGRQWVDKADIKEVVRVLKSDWVTQGPVVEQFEKAVAKYCGAKYAVAVSSGTAALYIAYRAAGIKEGDEVITTPLTFAATANMAAMLGAKPVFADIDEKTLNIDPGEIEKKITGKTKAIMPVDFAGRPCDYSKIIKIARENNILVIEDACHALGAKYNGKKIGSLADMTILSFHPVKAITTGEGGMVLTNNKDFYEKLKVLRNHGMVKNPEKGKWHYEIEEPSFNCRITDIQCALGFSQLKKLDKFLQKRRQIAKAYSRAFADLKNIIIPAEEKNAESAWHLYPVQFQGDRGKIFDFLQKNGINCQVHYMPLHMHPFYKIKFGFKEGDFPNAEKYYKAAISLPIFPKMSEPEIKKVIKIIQKI